MRKLNALLYLFLIGLVSLTACTDDDDDAGPSVAANTINIDGKTKNVTIAGTIDLTGSTTTSDHYMLIITDGEGDNAVGIGLNIAPNATTLAGTFNPVSLEEENPAPNTFSYAFIGFDCTEGDDCSQEYNTAATPVGKVTISKDGNIYTVNFDITFEGNKKGLGNYKGNILM
jgi:hypothetical protein